ncbi:hypothetical protein LguiA_024156 [Lonicera macranthoides]
MPLTLSALMCNCTDHHLTSNSAFFSQLANFYSPVYPNISAPPLPPSSGTASSPLTAQLRCSSLLPPAFRRPFLRRLELRHSELQLRPCSSTARSSSIRFVCEFPGEFVGFLDLNAICGACVGLLLCGVV